MVVLAAALGGASGASHACSAEDYLSTICIMAATRTNINGYQLANGASLPINAYSALYSLIGVTYGGNGTSNFQVPDLRGKVVIGAGTAADGTPYPLGSTGGQKQVSLTVAQLPAHIHPLSGATANLTGVTGTTDLSKVTGGSSSASLNGIAFSASGANLSLNANSGTAGSGSPTGAALATPSGPANKIYSSTAPNVTMMAGSIGGTVNGSLSGAAPVTLAGTAPTTLGGTASVTGSTGPAGSNAPIPTLPPYVALYYYINVQGLYPSFD
jgi:microcystin-dependent protein